MKLKALLFSGLCSISQSSHAELWTRNIINDSDFIVQIQNLETTSSNYIDDADFSDAHRDDGSDFNGSRSSTSHGLLIQPHTTKRIYVITSQYDFSRYAIRPSEGNCFAANGTHILYLGINASEGLFDHDLVSRNADSLDRITKFSTWNVIAGDDAANIYCKN